MRRGGWCAIRSQWLALRPPLVRGPFVATLPVHVLLIAEAAGEEAQELSAAAFRSCSPGRHAFRICKRRACRLGRGGVTCVSRRRGQVVRRQTANLLFVGSIPTGASSDFQQRRDTSGVLFFGYVQRSRGPVPTSASSTPRNAPASFGSAAIASASIPRFGTGILTDASVGNSADIVFKISFSDSSA